MHSLTAEQIRTLAPDAAAARAGEALGNPKRWSSPGRTETAAWGLCQGSGSVPYQSAVDLSGPAYKCSCPSRKIPCKHALGLLFLLADGTVEAATPPEWVETWLASRSARAEAAATRTERAEADPAARAKRVESRERKVAGGLEELDRWLGDLMRRGLDSARGEGYRFWDAMGARLVDAQAGGLGRQVRSMGSAANAGDAWPHLLLDRAARLHLVCEAYGRASELPEPLVADVRSLVGWTVREEELDGDLVEDRWLVVGHRTDDSGPIETARTFLVGEATGRPALHLSFGVAAAPPTVLAVTGQAFRATLAFYPSATPLRAAVRPVIEPDGVVVELPGAAPVDEVLRGQAARLAANPFLDRWPVVVGPVVPVLRAGRVLLRGEDDEAGLPVVPDEVGPLLLAVSGGRPVTVCGEWDGAVLRPMSVLADRRLVAVDAAEGEDRWDRGGDPEWAALVSAALLGTERAGNAVPVPVAAGGVVTSGERDREHVLLAAGAVTTIRLRAGRRATVDAAPLPEPAPADPRSSLDGAPARLLGLVALERPALLTEVLGLARASGRRLPDETLPRLLRLGELDEAIEREVADLGGPRAAWLRATVPGLGGGAEAPPGDDPDAWDDARGGRELAALVRRARAADPAAGRALVAQRLAEVAGDEREAVVAALVVGLDAGDEPLLTAALGDRRQDVRRAAADLLARLPGSAFASAVEAAARPLLASSGRLRPGLAITLPAADDPPGLALESLTGKAPTGYGERAWRLRFLLGFVRPARWTAWLGLDERELVGRAIRADGAAQVLDGWWIAAARFADPRWAAALLAEPRVAATIAAQPRSLVVAIDPADRAGVVARVAGSLEPAAFASIAASLPPPWPAEVGAAALAVLGPLGDTEWPDAAYYELVRAAARGLPPDRAEDLVELASRQDRIRPSLEDAVEVIRLRARIHQAFADLPPISPTEARR